MFRLGRHHARLTQWHKDLVGVDNVAVNARHKDVVGRANGRVPHHASRTPTSRWVANKSKDARRFVRC